MSLENEELHDDSEQSKETTNNETITRVSGIISGLVSRLCFVYVILERAVPAMRTVSSLAHNGVSCSP
ncbi:MAG: hypothetical protein R2783_09280 [Gelidibacter sp.]